MMRTSSNNNSKISAPSPIVITDRLLQRIVAVDEDFTSGSLVANTANFQSHSGKEMGIKRRN